MVCAARVHFRLLAILLSVCITTVNGIKMRRGVSKVIDFENPNFDPRTELEKENTKEKMERNVMKKCTSNKPADILLKSKSGIEQTYIVVLCNKDKERQFRNMFKKIIIGEMDVPNKEMKMFKVQCGFRKVRKIAKHPFVAEVEQESFIQPEYSCERQIITDDNLWGIDRIGRKNHNRLDERYFFNTRNQEHVDVYVIDTGITPNEKEFGDRIKKGAVCVHKGCFTEDNLPGPGSEPDLTNQSAQIDVIGHGTHVSGIIGSKTYGTSKGVIIIPVKLLDFENDERRGRFTLMTILSALSWALERVKKEKKQKLSVVNMSLGGPLSVCMNRMINLLTAENITVVAAAGNEKADACSKSPGSAYGAITAGCSTKSDTFCVFSNFGRCVDILAPGMAIASVSNVGGKRILSGTSMSTPHVSGAAAILMAQYFKDGGLDSEEVKNIITQKSTRGAISDFRDQFTPNKLLNVKCKRPRSA